MAREAMDREKRLSSVELERLLLQRRRQEAVEGLRSLFPLGDESGMPVAVEPIEGSGLRPPGSRPALPRSSALAAPGPVDPGDGGATAHAEDWLRPQRVRLQPPQSRRRVRRRPPHPFLLALQKKGLPKVVDALAVILLILIVAALGLWIYENWLRPLLDEGGSPVQAEGSSLWPGQGALSSTGEYVPSAPLPFVPYSTTVAVEDLFIPVPTPAPGTVLPTRLVIPAIQLDTPVVEVTIENGMWQVAQYAAGYHRGTARPGTVGNTVISGHNGMYGAVFLRLAELNPGDEVFLYAKPRVYRYVVQEKKSVWPHEVEVMAQTADSRLTLITCTAYDTQRLIVVALFDREVVTGSGLGP